MTDCPTLNLGDVVTCSGCGATAEAYTTDGAGRWRSGDAVMITWRNGPRPRHTSARTAPDLCMWCDDRRLGWPSLMARPLPREAPEYVEGPRERYEIPPVERETAQGALQRANAIAEHARRHPLDISGTALAGDVVVVDEAAALTPEVVAAVLELGAPAPRRVPDSLADADPTICYAPGCFSVATVGNRCAACAERAAAADARAKKKPKKSHAGQGSLF